MDVVLTLIRWTTVLVNCTLSVSHQIYFMASNIEMNQVPSTSNTVPGKNRDSAFSHVGKRLVDVIYLYLYENTGLRDTGPTRSLP